MMMMDSMKKKPMKKKPNIKKKKPKVLILDGGKNSKKTIKLTNTKTKPKPKTPIKIKTAKVDRKKPIYK